MPLCGRGYNWSTLGSVKGYGWFLNSIVCFGMFFFHVVNIVLINDQLIEGIIELMFYVL